MKIIVDIPTYDGNSLDVIWETGSKYRISVNDNNVVKERLVFIKKHNKLWDIDEIREYESLDEDWFSEDFGFPIIIRFDYTPEEHIECEHPSVHLTISNHVSCRIPVKGVISFSEFVEFILLHFYNYKLKTKCKHFENNEIITELEKTMLHLNWK